MKRLSLSILFIAISCAAFCAEESWMGIYLKGSKIGYAGTRVIPDEFAGRGGTKTWSINVIKAEMVGSSLEIETASESWKSASGAIKKMVFRTSSGGRRQSVVATFGASQIDLKIDNNGDASTKILKIPSGVTIVDDPMDRIEDFVATRSRSKTVWILDPVTLELVKNTIQSVGMKEFALNEKAMKGYEVDVIDPRATTKSYYSAKGDLIKAEGPIGMEMFPESREKAVNLGGKIPVVDLSESSRILTDKPIENASDTKSVELFIKGIDLSRMPSDPMQTVTKLTNGYRVVIHPDEDVQGAVRGSKPLPAPGPSMLMPSDSPKFRHLAATITEGSKGDVEKAERLRKYVYDHMRTSGSIGVLRNATEILDTCEGLCRDHAILLTTLIRSAGINARLASGLIYSDGAFYYHAWTEAYLNKAWRGVDSTRSEKRFSAVHLKIAEGNVEDAFLFFTFEGAKIQVRNVEYKAG